MALGQAIKMFAKFQCQEIMPCMVKLNDLEELAKPPLGGAPLDSTLASLQKEAMDLDKEVGRWAGANNTTQFSPKEENFSLV
jgi:hypothetical protein